MKTAIPRTIAICVAAVTLCSGQDVSQTAKARAVAPATSSFVAAQLKIVEDQLKEQQAQLSQQRSLVAQQQAQITQLELLIRQNIAALQEQAQQVQEARQQTKSAEVAAGTASSTWNASVKGIELNLQETRKSVQALEHPTALRFKGVNLTPSGFLSTDFLFRSRNENADVSGNFGGLPFGGVANSQLTEFRESSRSSRLALLVEGMAGKVRLSGYYEVDFLAQAPTANQVQTNSFSPRQRQLWAQADFTNGLTLTAGQDWSLITTDRKGIATRAEFIPNTLEASYVVGYNYTRQTGVRITKNFNNRVWGAFELGNPETAQPNASFTPPNVFGFNNSANASSPNGSTINLLGGTCPASTGFLCNPSASTITNGFSTNLAPDILAKIAWEPGWGPYEFKALGRFFRDRINSGDNVNYGGGLGFGAILPVVRSKVDVIAEGLVGNGIGRYGAAAGPDVTLRPDGMIIPIHTLHAMVGVELHPQPKLDVFLYGGDEYYGRAAYVNPTDATKPAGYGSPLVNNTNCGVEVLASTAPTCGAQNRNVWDGTAGFWYRFYKGPFGTLQYGAQYEYLYRGTWSGFGGAPKGLDNVALTSLRFYLP